MLDFTEYSQHTHRTAEYPEDQAVLYLALGIADEAGELVDEIEDRPNEGGVKRIRAEAGDVFWYASELIRRLADDPDGWRQPTEAMSAGRVGAITSYKSMDFDFGKERARDALTFSAAIAGEAKKALRDDNGEFTEERRESILYLVTSVRRSLEKAAHHLGLGGYEVVLEANAEKLSIRSEKGLIKGEGEGDERVSTT